MMQSWYAVLGSLLALLILRAPAVADASDAPHSGREADCKSENAWVSRNFAMTPTARRDCVLAQPGSNQELRVSHLRRGGSTGTDLFTDPLALTPTPGPYPGPYRAPVHETRSRVELAGSWSRWSYETKFQLGREARFNDGRLQPQGRTELRLKSSLDLGILRPGVELREALVEEQLELPRGFDVRGDSRSLAGGRAFVDVAIPGVPVLSVAIGREQKDVFDGRTLDRHRLDSDFLTGGIWYQSKSWQASAVSSVYHFRDEIQPGARGSQLQDYFIYGSYWPKPSLTINPTVGYSEASFDGGGSWIRTLVANLGVYSSPVGQNGLLTLWSGYTRSYDTSRSFDYEQLDLAVGAERAITDIARLGGYGLSVGGSVGYSHYFDRLHPGNSGPGYRALLTLRIAAAPECAGRERAMTRACSMRPGI